MSPVLFQRLAALSKLSRRKKKNTWALPHLSHPIGLLFTFWPWVIISGPSVCCHYLKFWLKFWPLPYSVPTHSSHCQESFLSQWVNAILSPVNVKGPLRKKSCVNISPAFKGNSRSLAVPQMGSLFFSFSSWFLYIVLVLSSKVSSTSHWFFYLVDFSSALSVTCLEIFFKFPSLPDSAPM